MTVPTPDELKEKYGTLDPEQIAVELGFRVKRLESPPTLIGVTVLSAYEPDHAIILYLQPLRARAKQRKEPLARLEQWHIAHELYHGLSEDAGLSPWRVRETEADLWADELLAQAR